MINMKDVYKTYANGVTALNGIDIGIDQGEFVYVVGPSGAGKSTFIRLIYREVKPTNGTIIIDDTDLSTLKKRQVTFRRRNVSVVFQNFILLAKLSVDVNIAFALEYIEKTPRKIRKRVMAVLELVGLKNKARFLPDVLSGGE